MVILALHLGEWGLCVGVGVYVGVHVGVYVGAHVGVYVGAHVGVYVGVHVGMYASLLDHPPTTYPHSNLLPHTATTTPPQSKTYPHNNLLLVRQFLNHGLGTPQHVGLHRPFEGLHLHRVTPIPKTSHEILFSWECTCIEQIE